MKKGFFDFENDDGYDFLKKLRINNEEINAFFYLHGICHEFALGLCETFNYNIVLWINYDEDINSNVLIHAFNTFKYKGKQYYIDIRGITDNIDDITDGFDYFEEVNNLSGCNMKEAISILKELGLKTDINSYFYEVINTYKTYYEFK